MHIFFWDRPWYSENCARRLHYIPYVFKKTGFCLIFVLRKNKGFQSEALLKILPTSLSMEEFAPDIQK